MRIGQGYDVHRLVEGRPLIIGGVEIEHETGLQGHSDADVLLHAICDALLGAAGQGDLGRHFPDTDPRWKDCDSRELLIAVRELIAADGITPVNIDSTIIAERPRLAPYIDQMRANIAADLGIETSQVNIKATTTEGLGFEGGQQGIAASAVVLCGAN